MGFKKAIQGERFWKGLTERVVLKRFEKVSQGECFWEGFTGRRVLKALTGREVLDFWLIHSTPRHKSQQKWIEREMLKVYVRNRTSSLEHDFSHTCIHWHAYIHTNLANIHTCLVSTQTWRACTSGALNMNTRVSFPTFPICPADLDWLFWLPQPQSFQMSRQHGWRESERGAHTGMFSCGP